jgi:spermidine synthase
VSEAAPDVSRGDGGLTSDREESAGRLSAHPYWNLFLLSVFLFYLEMTAIRLVSTEIRIFAYFKNLALIACFFGMGAGCLLEHRKRPRFVWTYPVLAFIFLVVRMPKRLGFDLHGIVTTYLGKFNDMAVWSWGQAPARDLGIEVAALALLAVLVALLAGLFLPGGRLMARLFSACPRRISAYSANVLGSFVGIWLFSGISALSWPPEWWIVTLFVLGAAFLVQAKHFLVAVIAAGVFVGAEALVPRLPGTEIWSPYQKLVHAPIVVTKTDGTQVETGRQVNVNDIFYQRIANLAPDFIARHIDLWPEARNLDYMSYNLVYRLQPRPQRVLVVGAGTGNDVAAALRNGAAAVDAVEIDPTIVEIGRRYHPERPYDDPRVRVIVADARSFFKRATARYDLIVFGALDSHTQASALSNIRIDNYVYTVESFREARALLADDGLLWLVFSVERPFIALRLRDMLHAAFGHEPQVFINRDLGRSMVIGGGPTFVIDRRDALSERLARDSRAEQAIREGAAKLTGRVALGTDDWPYLYLERPAVPQLYIIVMGVILVMAALFVRPLVGHLRRLSPFYFLMGAAFLLVEVQAISKMALLFGTTWFVNSVALSAVLGMILIANVIVARFKIRPLVLGPAFLCLAVALILNRVFPFAVLLGLSPIAKALAAGVIMGLPVLFSGVIFAALFADVAEPGLALGANLLGAILGGAFESLSFVTGISALALVALLFYVGAFVAWRRGVALPLS